MLILLLLPQILNQPPFLPLHLLKTLKLVNGRVRRRRKRKDKKKKTKQKVTIPTSNRHVGIPPATDHHAGSIDVPIFNPHKVKFPCRLYKGDHLLKDCPSLSLVSEV